MNNFNFGVMPTPINSVRYRLEHAAPVQPRPAPLTPEEERAARLAQNARKIAEDQVNVMLLQMAVL